MLRPRNQSAPSFRARTTTEQSSASSGPRPSSREISPLCSHWLQGGIYHVTAGFASRHGLLYPVRRDLHVLFYVYPINAVLFEQAGGTRSPDEIRALANAWIFGDRLRFGVGLIGFAAVLHAFRLPIPEARETVRSTGA